MEIRQLTDLVDIYGYNPVCPDGALRIVCVICGTRHRVGPNTTIAQFCKQTGWAHRHNNRDGWICNVCKKKNEVIA